MKPLRFATLISDRDHQFIDHLAPLSDLLKIPMVVSDEETETLIQTHYPYVEIIYKHPLELGFYLTRTFEVIYTCLPSPLFREIAFTAELIDKKTLFNIWCPHGNSDKGCQEKYMEFLDKEQFALVYGQQMIDFLIKKGSFDQLKGTIITGNYRLKHYEKHKMFFLKKLEELVFLEKKNKTILYSPTWNDSENSSSFEDACKYLIETIPDYFNLLIKPHPHLFSSPQIFELFMDQFPKKKNIAVLSDFPPVYPVLDFVDIYLGDMSSIGYDFLSFKKPMFFLNTNKRNPKKDQGLYLTRCGTLIEPEDYKRIFSIIEDTDASPFKKIQSTLYNQVFGKGESFKEKVIEVYESMFRYS